MKPLLPILFLLLFCLGGYAQTKTAKDSTHFWTIHGQNTFLINQASFSNWAAGGVNSVAANAVIDYDFDYKKDKLSWDNKVIGGYGLSKQTGIGWRKNDDRLIMNSLLGYKASQYWLYTMYVNFQTQFSDGFAYNGDQKKLISALFAPAYITFGPGFAYKKSDNFRVNLSPVASRITLVLNDSLSNLGAFGVRPGNKALYAFGASVDAYYKANLAQNIALENILKLYSDYLNTPTNIYMDYTINLYMKVNKFVTVNAGLELISDPYSQIAVQNNGVTEHHSLLQEKQIFGAGVTYKF